MVKNFFCYYNKKMIQNFLNEFTELKNEEKARHLSRFFKTGKGDYGEDDVFLGLTVPQTRAIAKKFYKEMPLDEIQELLKSSFHEIRLGALLMCVLKYQRGIDKKKIYELYINNTNYINNWDLVDLTAPYIAGDFVYNYGSEDDLRRLAQSSHLWSERISVVSSLYFIKQNSFDYIFDISEYFLGHSHDLMHKACGWMLREAGKRNQMALEKFLDKNAPYMPRTMLRYAIEKFDEKKRKKYLAIKKIQSRSPV